MPEVILIFVLSPVSGRQRKEFAKRFIAKPLAGLGNRAGSQSLTFLRTQDEVEFCHNVRDGAVAVQAHADNEPHSYSISRTCQYSGSELSCFRACGETCISTR